MKTIHLYLWRERGTTRRPRSILSVALLTWLFISMLALRQHAMAQTPVVPFGSCEAAGLFQLLGTGANQQVYQYNAELGVHTLFTNGGRDYQGLAYNRQTNLLYAVEKRGSSLMLLTIDQNKVKRDVGVVVLPNNINGMEFDGQGYLYATVQNNSTSMFKIDVRTATPTLAVTSIPYSVAVDVYDFGFDDNNNVFYSVDNNAGKNVLKILPNGTVFNLGGVGLTGTFGSINLDVNGNLIIYENTGSLRAVRYVLDDSVVPGDVYTVHASQPNSGNNADFAGCGDLGDIPYSDLAIVKTVDQSSPFMGDTISFTLQVTNLTGPFFDYAPRRATGVVASDLLPNGYTWLSDNSSGKYNPGTGVWTLDSLNVGQTKSLTLTVLVNNTGTYTNTTTVSSTIWDPHLSNNADTVATTPKRPAPNLYLLKSGFFVDADSNSVPSPGDSIRYVFKLSNTGNVLFTSVTLDDTLLTVLGGPLSNFAPAEEDSTTFTGSYLLTSTDIDTGFVKNRAKATGYTALGDTVVVESMAEFPLDPQDPFYDETCPECTIITLPSKQADLSILKTVDEMNPFAEDTVEFRMIVRNNGPSMAKNVMVLDSLNTGFEYVSHSGPGSFTFPDWDLGDMSEGEIDTLYIRAIVKEQGVYSNTATVQSDTMDPDSTNNSSTVRLEPYQQGPALKLVKFGLFQDSDGNGVPNAGDTLRYTFHVENMGNVPFNWVDVMDSLITVNGGPLTSLAVMEKDSLSFSGSYVLVQDDVDQGFVKNRAYATGITTYGDTLTVASVTGVPLDPRDPFYDETCPECTIVVLPDKLADLSVVKTVDTLNPFVEDTVEFRIVVTNEGQSNAKNVVLLDSLNTGFEYVSHSGSGTYTFPNWDLGNMAKGKADTLYIVAIVKEQGLYTNTAKVSSDTMDPDTTNNSSSVTLEPMQQGPALKLVKSGFFEDSNGNGTPNAGDTLRYTFKVENIGNLPFTWVDVIDSLITVNGGPLSGLDISEKDSLSFTGLYVLAQQDVDLGFVKNRAYAMGISSYGDTLMVPSVTGVPLDPQNPFYDEECPECTITVLPKVQADLSITKSASTLTPVFGDTITFQIGVTNNGTSPATGVTVNEPIPSGFQLISASGAGSYTNPTWTIGNLSVGSTAFLQLEVKVLNEGNYQNIVRVSGSLFDPDTTNNVASVTVAPTPNAEILVIKTADKDSLIPGDPISFSFMITNNGPNSASAVTLTDNLPAGYGSITNISNGGTLTGNTVVWPAFNLAVGDTVYRSFDAIVQATGPYENTAIVVATEFDPILPNNTSTTKPLVNPKKKIYALDDEYVLPVEEQGSGNPSVGNVLTNDALNGSPATLSNVVLTVIEPSTEPGVQLNPLTGVVSVAGNLGAGPFTLTYRICEIEMPSNCDLGVVTVRVTQRRVLRLTSIEGNIWYEYVEDDVWDDKLAAGWPAALTNETPMQGWKVNLYGSDLYGNSISQSTLTRQDGSYIFENIPEGRYRIDREYREEWVPAFPLVIRDDPKGKFHIINVDYGYGGLASNDRRVVAGNEKGWLLDVEAGKDSLYAGAYLYLDTNMDNLVDQTLFVSGSMFMSWKDVSNNRVDYNIDGLYMQGWSKDLTDIDLRLLPQRAQPGTLIGGLQDSLVNSSVDLRFELRVSGERWTTQFEAPVRLQGQVAQMLPYQQRHTLEPQAGYDFYNGYGRKVARLLGMEFMPLYGADFGVNQSIFGTAPDDKYPVRMETDGARHVQPVLLTERKLLLGTGLDQSLLTVRNNLRHGVITQKTAVTGYGVEFLNDIRAEQEGQIKVTTTDQGYLHAWIDFNKDGIWSTTEKVVNGQRLNQGETTLSFMVPNTVRSGVTYARFRYCDCPSGLTAQGVFTGGEVEDYRLNLSAAYGSITGEVWQDHNANGIRDPQDQGLSNMRVFVDYNQNRIYETGEPLALTNETGAFTIQNVPVGTWNVQPDYEGKWLLTNIPGPPFATVAMQEAAVKSSVDFGLMRLKLTSTDDDSALPLTFDLEQNYPNPFNPVTTINYQLAEKSYVKLTVLDLNGRVVATLVDREMAAGRYSVKFDGAHLSSGVYVYQLVAGDVTMTRKMTLLK